MFLVIFGNTSLTFNQPLGIYPELTQRQKTNFCSFSLTKDVVMSHQEGLINFSLSEPALFLCGEKHFDGHSLSSPSAHPHLSVSPFPDLLHHLNLLGDGSLHLETKCLFNYVIPL